MFFLDLRSHDCHTSDWNHLTLSGLPAMCLIVILLLMSIGLSGCKTTALQASPQQTQISTHTIVPLDMRAEVPIISVMINGNGPYRFILDTGADVMYINRHVIEQLGLPDSDYQWDQINSYNGRLEVKRFKHIESLTIGKAEFKHFDVAEWNHGTDQTASDISFAGLINARLFYDVIMTIDYPNNKLILSPYQPLRSRPDTLKFYMKDSIHMSVDLKVGKQTMPFIVDTGASIPFVFINHPGEGVNWITQPRRTETIMTAYGPNSNVYKGQMRDNVMLGSSIVMQPEVYNVLTSDFIMSGTDQKKIMIKQQRSLMGSETMKYFIVSFDQRAGYIRFRPPIPGIDIPIVSPAK